MSYILVSNNWLLRVAHKTLYNSAYNKNVWGSAMFCFWNRPITNERGGSINRMPLEWLPEARKFELIIFSQTLKKPIYLVIKNLSRCLWCVHTGIIKTKYMQTRLQYVKSLQVSYQTLSRVLKMFFLDLFVATVCNVTLTDYFCKKLSVLYCFCPFVCHSIG